LESPDAVYLARYAIRAFSRRRGYEATFMARPTFRDFASGFHLNHSLWDSNGRDVFFDSADPQKLSVFAKHWIAGLVHHTPALCALFSPTVNCYHRFASGLAPSTVYWNFDDRLSAYRAKTSQTGAYLENRLPSSACNPYITFAATIAAGLDGVERKLECPAPGRPEEGAIGVPVIPKTLGEALDWLEKDTALVEALGGKMVEYFAALKREFEIKHFKNNTSTDMSKAEVIDIERKYYMPFI
jgi:glutamine synthetase